MGKIMAIDYGRKRMGLASSDDESKFAFALESLTFEKFDRIYSALLTKIAELNPEKIIIGVPLGFDLKPTQMSLEIESFITKLTSDISTEIIRWNEVGTSKIAQQNLRTSGKKDIDSESARIILQEYLDFKN